MPKRTLDGLACTPWTGKPQDYQDQASRELYATGWRPVLYCWITPVCGTDACLTVEHLEVHAPLRLHYPSEVCIYCGRPGYTRDHLLPRSWTGLTQRNFVATVPACGECNSIIGDRLTVSITERREIAHDGLRRKHASLLRTVDYTPEELDEFGPNLRLYIRQQLMEKKQLLDRLRWPHDPAYDMRALETSGIDDPFALGLIVAA